MEKLFIIETMKIKALGLLMAFMCSLAVLEEPEKPKETLKCGYVYFQSMSVVANVTEARYKDLEPSLTMTIKCTIEMIAVHPSGDLRQSISDCCHKTYPENIRNRCPMRTEGLLPCMRVVEAALEYDKTVGIVTQNSNNSKTVKDDSHPSSDFNEV
ncbi:hypothetical protein RF11_08531 [Thelohanellus kitauei]|uniref:Uncharacterized protein n=1 Tax=Thelohanellus kitauei TaxID=669202 RepID=A0A0C2N800_THEKT|nr:hypothetical protein RF11_08531 [Thelohanellus kitauei]